MPRQSNKALEKFNKPTAESIERKQAKELVDDEYNDIRRQLIRRQFDQVRLYNELFDANRQKFGDTLVEFKLMELFRSYINQIGESRIRLGENRPKPFNDLIGAYNAFISSLSTYVDLAKKEKTVIDVKSYQDQLRESAIPLQELLDIALGLVSGAISSVPIAAPQPSAPPAPEMVAEQEDRRQPEPEWRRNPLLQMPEPEPEWRRNPLLPPVPGRGKAHGGNIGDFLKRFAINFALNKRVGQGDGGRLFASREDFYKNHAKKHGGMNTDMIWKFLLGAGVGKAFGGNKPTETDILDLFNLLKEVQRGFVPNQLFRGVSAMTDAEKKNKKEQLSAFEGAFEGENLTRSYISEVIGIINKRIPEYTESDLNDVKTVNGLIQILEKSKEDIMVVYSRVQSAKKGDYRPGELKELKELTKSIDDQLEVLNRQKKKLGGMKTDTNFGQLVAESEARNPRKKNCHYNTRGFLISCSGKAHGKAHGGQAGFSLDKTREIVDQWPGFPYYVPPASKTGPMLDNPRSRVNNRTEANGKPKRICKQDMSEASIACRRGGPAKPDVGPMPVKRGRPKKSSPKSPKEGGVRITGFHEKRTLPGKAAGKKKKAKKSGKPKYDVI